MSTFMALQFNLRNFYQDANIHADCGLLPSGDRSEEESKFVL